MGDYDYLEYNITQLEEEVSDTETEIAALTQHKIILLETIQSKASQE